MNRKAVLFSILAVFSVVALLAISAVTVYALIGDSAVQVEETTTENLLDRAPNHEVEPVLTYENVGHAGKPGGCPYERSAKLQLTQAPSKAVVEQQPLAQAGP